MKKKRTGRRAKGKHELPVNVQVHPAEPPLRKPSDDEQLAPEAVAHVEAVPYDENLLERARTQWQFGDWPSLDRLDRDALQHHPDRAKLALLAAAGRMQQGDNAAAREFTRLAQDWGCSRRLISQILIAGVHNTLGRAAASSGQETRALRHFESAISIGAPASAIRLLARARAREQLEQLGLTSHGAICSEDQAAPGTRISHHTSDIGEPAEWIIKLVDECFAAGDLLEAVDHVLEHEELAGQKAFSFFLLLSERFRERQDTLTALHFLNLARERFNGNDQHLCTLLAKKFIELGRADDAADILVRSSLSQISASELSDSDKKALESSYQRARSAQMAKTEHGHELLLTYLRQFLPSLTNDLQGRQPVLVEIGTTRENVPGQGSTRKIANFCKEHGLHFITVDMDPHNTRVAATAFREMQTAFEAINMKGEDYLDNYAGSLDVVFLDAYDFDHGKHSRLRQSRYEKFLGAPVDDGECHRMHLACAKSIEKKLSRKGLVCIDDTWLEDGRWTAKGTLAMPYLIEHGFRVLEARNRAALLSRLIEPTVDL